jgi:hypothetical protein
MHMIHGCCIFENIRIYEYENMRIWNIEI